MGFAEKRDDYWRGRYKLADGRYGTVQDESGATIRFRTKRDAERAANEAEANVRNAKRRDPSLARITFSAYVNRWYAVQDLAASTMQNYRRHIEDHLLPAFGEMPVTDIKATDIAAWEKRERAVGYAESSIRSWRSRLHLILADAVEEGIRESNPAARRRGRGRRTGRSAGRAPEKAITDPLGVLLIAERVALLSGRDDDFVAVVLKAYTGMRWGEVVGLEVPYLRPAAVRVEWQLYELDTGELLRCPPKDGSRRTIDLPDWLDGLLTDHVARTAPKPCTCHGLRYVFSGHRPPNGATRRPGATLVDVAQRVGVSPGTVSASFNHAEVVHEATRARIAAAVAELGYVRGGAGGELAAHPRRSNFATWLFQPAATGQYPKKGRLVVRPVPVVGEPWPGVPVRGRNAAGRADACWLPIAPGLTPHGLRHTHKTVMEELGTPSKLMDERMGHDDGSVQAVYSHITAQMRRRLLDGLTALWRESLEARRAMTTRSPVGVLDRLLRERSGE